MDFMIYITALADKRRCSSRFYEILHGTVEGTGSKR
jgi:hypothetical protein